MKVFAVLWWDWEEAGLSEVFDNEAAALAFVAEVEKRSRLSWQVVVRDVHSEMPGVVLIHEIIAYRAGWTEVDQRYGVPFEGVRVTRDGTIIKAEGTDLAACERAISDERGN